MRRERRRCHHHDPQLVSSSSASADYGVVADPPKQALRILHDADDLWVVHEICPAEWIPVRMLLPEITHEQQAQDYAKNALRHITGDPGASGVHAPWTSVDEWVAFELASGFAADLPMIDYAATKAALRNVATLEALNAPFENIEPPRCTPPEPPTQDDHQP